MAVSSAVTGSRVPSSSTKAASGRGFLLRRRSIRPHRSKMCIRDRFLYISPAQKIAVAIQGYDDTQQMDQLIEQAIGD